MTLENIFYLSQAVAGFALVGSLLFLGLEVHHRNLETRHRSTEESLQKLRDVELHMCGDADRARVWLSGLHDYAALASVDKVRFQLTAHMALKANESFFLAYQEGRLTRDVYEPEAQHQADFLAYPGFQTAWDMRKQYFSKAYREWVNEKIAAATKYEGMPSLYREESAVR
jgi:hypothetical protein